MKTLGRGTFDVYALALPRGHGFGERLPHEAWQSDDGKACAIVTPCEDCSIGLIVVRRRVDGVWAITLDNAPQPDVATATAVAERKLQVGQPALPVPAGVRRRPALYECTTGLRTSFGCCGRRLLRRILGIRCVSHILTDGLGLGLGRSSHYRSRVSNPKRHHYLPEFYQKAWMGDDNKVTVYRRRHGGRLDIQRKARKSVGWESELYADLSEADPELRQRIESIFFKRVDGLAYEALAEMLITAAPPVDRHKASAWARFLMSLLHRHPERIALLRQAVELDMDETIESVRQQYPSLRLEDDPESFEEYITNSRGRLQDGVLALLLPRIVDSQNVGDALLAMTWAVGAAQRTKFRFLTSDRPLMTSNGLGHRASFLLLPISPQSYFVAAKRAETIEAFRLARPDDVIAGVNHSVCLQAEEFVIGHDEAQTRFIDNRLGGSPLYPVVRDSRGSIFWENPHKFDPWIA